MQYRSMAAAAQADGVSLILVAGYQDADTRQAAYEEKLKSTLEIKNAEIEKVYGGEPFDYDEMVAQFKGIREKMLPMSCDSVSLVNEALENDKVVLFEGAQANMLDINYGTYPFVTSSSPTSAGVLEGAGVPPQSLTRIIGVAKAYSTRVGEGPYITELLGDEGEALRQKGFEFGATTGRPRRMGWFDAVASRYGCRIQGATEVALTVLDVLGYLDELPVCVGYEIDGKVTKDFPTTASLKKAKPVYEVLPGWKTDIRGITEYDKLPENCRKYIEFIEKELGVPVKLVSNGPGRHEIIHR